MTAPAKFRLGPLGFAITAGDWEAWLKAAKPGEAIVYAHGLVLPQGSAAVIAAREAAAGNMVHLTRRARDGRPGERAFEWIATKKGAESILGKAAAPAPAAPAVADDGEGPEAAVLRVLTRAANFAMPGPTHAEIARAVGLKDHEAARYLVRKLISAGSIRVEDRGPRARRIYTIVATGKRTKGGAL